MDEEGPEGIAVAKALDVEINPPLMVIGDVLIEEELRLDAGRKAEKLSTVLLKKVQRRKNKQNRLILINFLLNLYTFY